MKQKRNKSVVFKYMLSFPSGSYTFGTFCGTFDNVYIFYTKTNTDFKIINSFLFIQLN